MDSAIDKAMVVSAIGAGALVVSHANDSYFWVVTQLSDFDVNTGYKIHTTGTLILGVTAITFLLLLDLFI